jgi:hypothetical protein
MQRTNFPNTIERKKIGKAAEPDPRKIAGYENNRCLGELMNTSRSCNEKAGSPAISFPETRSFPTPPHDSCGFINFPALTEKQGNVARYDTLKNKLDLL